MTSGFSKVIASLESVYEIPYERNSIWYVLCDTLVVELLPLLGINKYGTLSLLVDLS